MVQFLGSTSGEVTERMYFESVRAALQLSPMTVRVVHPACTDAVGLVRAAIDERDRINGLCYQEIASFDHVWVLFDTDICSQQGQLSPALELARNENIHIGHSTPSVEVWLLLHFRDRPGPLLNSATAERAVGDAWGRHYDKRADTFRALWSALQPNIASAANRARQTREYHQQANSQFPANPSTQLDLLIQALDASVQSPMRIIR